MKTKMILTTVLFAQMSFAQTFYCAPLKGDGKGNFTAGGDIKLVNYSANSTIEIQMADPKYFVTVQMSEDGKYSLNLMKKENLQTSLVAVALASSKAEAALLSFPEQVGVSCSVGQ